MALKNSFFFALFFSIFLLSCKKESVTEISSNKSINRTKPIVEKVDSALLEKYFTYISLEDIESKTTNANYLSTSNFSKISKLEFQTIIDNYLANERNVLRENYYLKNSENPAGVAPNEGGPVCYDMFNDPIPCEFGDPEGNGNTGGGSSVTCAGTIGGYSTASSVFFTANMNGTTVTNPDTRFTGVSGTWTTFGQFNQSVHQSVTTYNQWYSHTWTLNGVNHVQMYIVYGNIYQGQCTVRATQVVNSPNQ